MTDSAHNMPLLHEQIHTDDLHTANTLGGFRAPAAATDPELGTRTHAALTTETGPEGQGRTHAEQTQYGRESQAYGYPPDKPKRDSRDDVTLAPSATISSTGNGPHGDKRGLDGTGNTVQPMDAVLEEEGDGVWGKMGEGSPNYKNVGW